MAHNYDHIHSSPQFEMTSPMIPMRPDPPIHNTSNISQSTSAATLLPHEPNFTHFESHFHKPEQVFTTIPYKPKTGKQFWHILLKSLARWLITVVLCVAYLFALRVWNQKGTVTEASKRIFNTITTGISIALGINIASSLKDMALNARWPILHARKRNLYELDLTLNADSLLDLGKLAFVSNRPLVFGMTISWLIFNIFVQAAIAAISLTYGFDTSTESYLFSPGNVTIPIMAHFYPQGNTITPEIEDEEYTAHAYGGLAWKFGIGESVSDLPSQGEIYQGLTENVSIFENQPNNKLVFVFTEYSSSASSQNTGLLGVYTNRTLDMHYSCSSHRVTGNGDGSADANITVKDIGTVSVTSFVSNGTTFFTDWHNKCPNIPRCAIVQAFEASDTDPWYYTCNITVGTTQNDPKNISFISDDMAYIAARAIANTGYYYTDQQSSSYPQKTAWGIPNSGNTTLIGTQIVAFGLSSISGAAALNPLTFYPGAEPHTGFALSINHTYFFLLIIFLIPLVQFVMCFGIAVWANRVVVQDNAYIGMSLLLRPIADALYGVSGGRDNKAFRDEKGRVMVRYERGVDGRWGFAMS